MKRKDNETQYPDPNENSTYQTGFTKPPKKYSLLVVILLVLVVFLSGLSSILGLLNVKMFSVFYEQEHQEEIPLSLEIDNGITQTKEETFPSILGTKIIGITGDPVTPAYQRHFQLPEGLFITYVEEGTSAHIQGIQEGDVLISLGDTKITDQSHIEAFLENRSIGDTFQAVVYRRDTDTRLTVELTVEEASS